MAEKKYICSTCGKAGVPEKAIKGSVIVELLFWLLMILPGLIYSIWRLTTKTEVCPACKNPTMIPLDSPVGQKLLKDYGG